MSWEQLARYRVIEKLGEGGMGAVYKALDPLLNREVALKILPEASGSDPRRRQRFLNEARAAAALNHPHIATIHSIEEDRDVLFLVLEYIPGFTLRDIIHSAAAPLPVQHAVTYCAQAAEALDAAHAKGIVHRDIKSANIMITPENRVKVLDFGLAKLQDVEGITKEHAILGTLGYMSPEQAAGRPLDQRADLWSLGVVLYEMLTGRLPFSKGDTQATLYAILNLPPEPLVRFRRDAPDWLMNVVGRALAKNREERYPDAKSLLRDLRATGISGLGPPFSASQVAARPLTPDPEATATRTRLSTGTAERRPVTFLYCEVSQASLGEWSQDPEAFDEPFESAREICERIVTRHDGQCSPWVGNSVVAYFGYPVAREDAPLRAVEAGLGIVEAFRRAEHGTREPLAVRVGVDSSLAVTGVSDRIAGEGAVVTRALAQLGEENSILLGPEVFRVVRDYFEVRDLGENRLPGLNRRASVVQVLHRSTARSRFDSADSTRLTALAGRGQEMELLLDRWQRAVDGSGQMVLLSGSPGMGKSRLAYELKRRVAEDRAAHLMECFCSPYFANTALYPVIEYVDRQVLDPERGARPEQKLKRLEGLLAEYALPLAANVPLLAPLFSLSAPGYAPLELTPDKQRLLAMEALVSLLIERAANQPVLLVIEDLHWADPSTTQWIGLLLDQLPGVQLLVVLTYRQEFAAPWRPGEHVTVLSVNRLTRSEAETVARNAAAGKEIPAAVLDQILQNSDGVPLFLEEVARMIVESEASSVSDRVRVPRTLRDSFMSRLDRLGPAKRIAQIASVLGREFPFRLLQLVTGDTEEDLRPMLKSLVDAGALYPRGTGHRFSYTFKHALLQEAAYDSLTRKTRAALHQQTAETLVESFPEYVQRQPEMLAHHYTEAGATALAIENWRLAGMKALERSAYLEAIAHFERGLRLHHESPANERTQERELLLLTSLGLPLIATRGFGAEDVGRNYERAQALTNDLGETPLLLPALYGAWVYNLVRGRLGQARDLAARIVAEGEARGNNDLCLEGYWVLGDAQFWLGEFAAAKENCERALSIYDPETFRLHAYQFGQDPGVAALCYLSFIDWYLGRTAEAMRRSDEALELARRIRHPFSIGWALVFPCTLHYFARDPRRALAQAEESIQYCTEQAYPFWITCAMVVKGWALCCQKRSSEGVPLVREGLKLMEAIGSEVVRPLFLGVAAEALLESGQPEEALKAVDEGLRIATLNSVRASDIDLWRIRGDVLRACGAGTDEVMECYRRAAALASERGAVYWERRAKEKSRNE